LERFNIYKAEKLCQIVGDWDYKACVPVFLWQNGTQNKSRASKTEERPNKNK